MPKGNNRKERVQMEVVLRPLQEHFSGFMAHLSEDERSSLGAVLLPTFQYFQQASTAAHEGKKEDPPRTPWEAHWYRMRGWFSFLSVEASATSPPTPICPFCDFLHQHHHHYGNDVEAAAAAATRAPDTLTLLHQATERCVSLVWREMVVVLGSQRDVDVLGDVVEEWQASWAAEGRSSTSASAAEVTVALHSWQLVVQWLASHRQTLYHSSSSCMISGKQEDEPSNNRNKLGWIGVLIRAARCYRQSGLEVMTAGLKCILCQGLSVTSDSSAVQRNVAGQREWLLRFFDLLCLLLDYHASMDTFCTVLKMITPEWVMSSDPQLSKGFHPAERWYKKACGCINRVAYGTPDRIALTEEDVIRFISEKDDWLTKVSRYRNPQELKEVLHEGLGRLRVASTRTAQLWAWKTDWESQLYAADRLYQHISNQSPGNSSPFDCNIEAMDITAIRDWSALWKQSLCNKRFMKFLSEQDGWREELVAVVMRAAELENSWKLSPSQIIPIILLAIGISERNTMLQIPTGTGKTWTIAIVAAIYALLGRKVDVVPSSTLLAARDHAETENFYRNLGITSGYVCPSNTVSEVELYSCDIVYGSVLNLSGDYQRSRMKGAPETMMWGTMRFDVALVDEADNLLIDRRSDTVRLSKPSPGEMPLLLFLLCMWGMLQSLSNQVVDDVSEEKEEAAVQDGDINSPPQRSSTYYYVPHSFDRDESRNVYLTDGEGGPLNGSMEDAINEYKNCREIISTDIDTFLVEKLKEWAKKTQIPRNARDTGITTELERELYMYRELRSEEGNPSASDRDLATFSSRVLPIMRKALTMNNSEVGEHDYSLILMPKYLKDRVTDHHIDQYAVNAVKALNHFKKGREYVVENGGVRVVDYQDTGVIHENMIWQSGLHQFLEMKEGLDLSSVALVSCSLSFAGFFKKYKLLHGMTGTLGNLHTREFLFTQYHFDTLLVPSPFRLNVLPDSAPWAAGSAGLGGAVRYPAKSLEPFVAPNKAIWWRAMVQYICRVAGSGRCVLVLMETIELVDELFAQLTKAAEGGQEMRLPDVQRFTGRREELKSRCQNLKSGGIMIGTNILGRGENLLPDDHSELMGGLHVCMTFLPISWRVELQNAGRTGRLGRLGTVQFILCLSEEWPISSQLPQEWKFGGNVEIHLDDSQVEEEAEHSVIPPMVHTRVPALEHLIALREQRELETVEHSKKQMEEMIWRDQFTKRVIDWINTQLFGSHQLRLLFQSQRSVIMDRESELYKKDLRKYQQKYPDRDEAAFREQRYIVFKREFFSPGYLMRLYQWPEMYEAVILFLKTLGPDEEDKECPASTLRTGDHAKEEEAEAVQQRFALWIAENLREMHSPEDRAIIEEAFADFLNSLQFDSLLDCNPHLYIKKAVRLFKEGNSEDCSKKSLALLAKAMEIGEGWGAAFIAQFYEFVPLLTLKGKDGQKVVTESLNEAKKLAELERNRIWNCIIVVNGDDLENTALMQSFEKYLELYTVLVSHIEGNIENLNEQVVRHHVNDLGIADYPNPKTLKEYLEYNQLRSLSKSQQVIQRMEVDGLRFLYTVGLVPAKRRTLWATLRLAKKVLPLIGFCIPQIRIAANFSVIIIGAAEQLSKINEWNLDNIKKVLMDAFPLVVEKLGLEDSGFISEQVASLLLQMTPSAKNGAKTGQSLYESCAEFMEDIGLLCGNTEVNGNDVITRGGLGLAGAMVVTSKKGYLAGLKRGFKELTSVYSVVTGVKSVQDKQEQMFLDALQMGIGSMLNGTSTFRYAMEDTLNAYLDKDNEVKQWIQKCLKVDAILSGRRFQLKLMARAEKLLVDQFPFSDVFSGVMANATRDALLNEFVKDIDSMLSLINAGVALQKVSSFPSLFFSSYRNEVKCIAEEARRNLSAYDATRLSSVQGINEKMDELRCFYRSLLSTHITNAVMRNIYASYARNCRQTIDEKKWKERVRRLHEESQIIANKIRNPLEPLGLEAIAAMSAERKVRIQLLNGYNEPVRDFGSGFEHAIMLHVNASGGYECRDPRRKNIQQGRNDLTPDMRTAAGGYTALLEGLPTSLYGDTTESVVALREQCATAVENNPFPYTMLMRTSGCVTGNTSALYILFDTFFKLRDESSGASADTTLEQRLESFVMTFKPSWIPNSLVYWMLSFFCWIALSEKDSSHRFIDLRSVNLLQLSMETSGACAICLTLFLLHPLVLFGGEVLVGSYFLFLLVSRQIDIPYFRFNAKHLWIPGCTAVFFSGILIGVELLRYAIFASVFYISILACMAVALCYANYILFEWSEMSKLWSAFQAQQFSVYQMSTGNKRQSKLVSFILHTRDSPEWLCGHIAQWIPCSSEQGWSKWLLAKVGRGILNYMVPLYIYFVTGLLHLTDGIMDLLMRLNMVEHVSIWLGGGGGVEAGVVVRNWVYGRLNKAATILAFYLVKFSGGWVIRKLFGGFKQLLYELFVRSKQFFSGCKRLLCWFQRLLHECQRLLLPVCKRLLLQCQRLLPECQRLLLPVCKRLLHECQRLLYGCKPLLLECKDWCNDWCKDLFNKLRKM